VRSGIRPKISGVGAGLIIRKDVDILFCKKQQDSTVLEAEATTCSNFFVLPADASGVFSRPGSQLHIPSGLLSVMKMQLVYSSEIAAECGFFNRNRVGWAERVYIFPIRDQPYHENPDDFSPAIL
jgi:hypothetical protein